MFYDKCHMTDMTNDTMGWLDAVLLYRQVKQTTKPKGAHEMRNSRTAVKTMQAIVEKMVSGDLSPVSEIVRLRRHEGDMGTPMEKWSFLNQLCVFLTKGTFDARGYDQWKKVGRHVKKGAKATYILVPVKVKYTAENEDGEEEERTWLRGFMTRPVFAVEDTEGEPLPTFDYTPKEPPALAEVAQALGIPVKYMASGRPALGCFKPNSNEIELYSEDTEVWYHELGHAIAKATGAKFADYNRNEVVAELTSAVLNMVYENKDVTGNAWKYISAYSDDPETALRTSMKHVERILKFIDSVQGGE